MPNVAFRAGGRTMPRDMSNKFKDAKAEAKKRGIPFFAISAPARKDLDPLLTHLGRRLEETAPVRVAPARFLAPPGPEMNYDFNQ